MIYLIPNGEKADIEYEVSYRKMQYVSMLFFRC